MVERVQETGLYQKIKEKESEFLLQVDVVINYATMVLYIAGKMVKFSITQRRELIRTENVSYT